MRKITVFATAVAVLGILLFCQHQLDNPLDPQSDAYVGDRSANDELPPAITYTGNFDGQVFVSDSIQLQGEVSDSNAFSIVVEIIPATGGPAQAVPARILSPNWSVTLPLQSDTNVFVVIATDSSYRQNATRDTLIIIGRSIPVAPANVMPDTEGQRIRISWQDLSANEEGFVILRSLDNLTYVAADTVAANSTSYLDTLTPSRFTRYYYKVLAFNDAGASPASVPNVVFYVGVILYDSTGPAISFVSPLSGQTVNNAPLVVKVAVTDPSGVKSVMVNNINAMLTGSWWQALLALDSGLNTIRVRSVDNSLRNNICSTSIQITYDPTLPDLDAPTITFVSPADSDTVAVASVTVVLHAEDPSGIARVLLNNAGMDTSNGFHTGAATLHAGMNALYFEAIDKVGNSARDTLRLVYLPTAIDDVPPVLTLLSPQPNSRIRTDSVTASGTATDASGIDSIIVNGVLARMQPPNWSARIPLVHGLNTIRVRAVDASSAGNEVKDSIVMVLRNSEPVFAIVADTTIPAGNYADTVAAHDADGEVLTFEPILLPPGVGLVALSESTAVIGTYAPTDTGVAVFSIRVKDVYNDADTMTWRVTVRLPDKNFPPYFMTTAASLDTNGVVGRLYTVNLDAVDPDGMPLTYSLAKAPTGMSINAASGLVSWMPALVDTGLHQVIAWASDGVYSVQLSWNVAVSRINRAPVFAPLSDTAIQEMQSLSFTILAADSDGNAITYSMPVFPAGAHLQNRVFSWTPTSAQSGRCVVTFVAADNATPPLSDTASITIIVGNLSGPPVFTSTPAMMEDSVEESAQYRDTVAASTGDGETITYAKLQGPSGLQVGATTGIVTFTPTAADSGTHTVSVTASNPSGEKDTLAWQLHVLAWAYVGTAGISNGRADFVSMGIDANGAVYVAYRDGGNQNKATVMRHSASGWAPLGGAGFTGDSVAYTSLFVGDGEVYLAYRDPGNNNRPTVQMHNGTDWSPVGNEGFGNGAALFTSVIVHNDTPHVAFVNTGNQNRVATMKFNGSNWVTAGSSPSPVTCTYPNLASSAGQLLLSFKGDRSGSTGLARVYMLNGNTWSTLGTNPSSGNIANYPSLFVSGTVPYLAYKDGANSNSATVRRYVSGAWEDVGAAGFTPGAVDYTSMQVGSGIPHVAFKDATETGKASVMRYVNSAWRSLGRAGFSEGTADYVCLVMNGSVPYVAFSDGSRGYRLTVMRFK